MLTKESVLDSKKQEAFATSHEIAVSPQVQSVATTQTKKMKIPQVLALSVAMCFTSSAWAGTAVNFGVGTEILACHTINDMAGDDIRDTHPYLQITQTESVKPNSRVVAYCIARKSDSSVVLYDISSNANPIDVSPMLINRLNNCKGPITIENAGFSADGRYAFVNAYWNGRPGDGKAGRFAIAFQIKPKNGGTGGTGQNNRPVPENPGEFLGMPVKDPENKKCYQYMSTGLAQVTDILVLDSEDPAAVDTDAGSGVRYLAVGKNAAQGGNLFDPNNTQDCKDASSFGEVAAECLPPLQPDNGVGGYFLP